MQKKENPTINIILNEVDFQSVDWTKSLTYLHFIYLNRFYFSNKMKAFLNTIIIIVAQN